MNYRDNLLNLMMFIRTNCPDEKHYCVIEIKDEVYEVVLSEGSWGIKERNRRTWTKLGDKELIDFIVNKGGDPKPIHNEALNIVVAKLYLANNLLEQAEKIFGKPFVDRSLNATKEFAKQVLSAVSKFTKKEKKPSHLTLVVDNTRDI